MEAAERYIVVSAEFPTRLLINETRIRVLGNPTLILELVCGIESNGFKVLAAESSGIKCVPLGTIHTSVRFAKPSARTLQERTETKREANRDEGWNRGRFVRLCLRFDSEHFGSH